MIDEKKIEEAAYAFLEKTREAYTWDCGIVSYSTEIKEIENEIKDDFVAGALWAQQEFVKSLWHDASEEPKEHTDIVYIDDKGNVWSEYDYCAEKYDDSMRKGWQSFITLGIILIKWCYLSDILPKEGGEE